MTMRAAVARDIGKLSVENVERPRPGPGEVLVRVGASGVCHTDLSLLNGRIPAPYPCVLGHEGAGVVDDVGDGVEALSRGDKVVLSIVLSCGACYQCSQGRPEICEIGTQVALGGGMMDWTSRLRVGDETLNHVFCQSSFAEYCVVPQQCAVKVRDDAPLDVVALLGCGVGTGFGAVSRRARVRPGSSVLVVGAGGVGLATVMAAKAAGAARIIATDVLDEKLALASELGATHTVNAAERDPVISTHEFTERGVEYAFDTVGTGRTLTQAFDATCPGGQVVAIGLSDVTAAVTVDLFSLIMEKNLTGTWAGSMRPAVDIPAAVDLFMDGRFPIDRLVTRRYELDDLPSALADMEAGVLARGVIVF